MNGTGAEPKRVHRKNAREGPGGTPCTPTKTTTTTSRPYKVEGEVVELGIPMSLTSPALRRCRDRMLRGHEGCKKVGAKERDLLLAYPPSTLS